jgi:hypothetical protein
VADNFSEFMEERVEKAKVEINSYVTSTLTCTGLNALGVDIEAASAEQPI